LSSSAHAWAPSSGALDASQLRLPPPPGPGPLRGGAAAVAGAALAAPGSVEAQLERALAQLRGAVGDGTRARAVVVDAGAAEGDDAGADESLAGQGPGPKMRQEDLIATIHALIYQQDLGRGAEEREAGVAAAAAAAALSSASSPRSAGGRTAPQPPAPSPARAPAAVAEPEVIDLLGSDDDDDRGGGASGEEVIEVLDSDEEADGGDGGDSGDDGGGGEMEDEEDGAFEGDESDDGGGYAAQQAQQFEDMQLAYVSSSDPRVREADVRRLAGVLFAPFLREQRLARMPGQKQGVAGRCLSDSVTWEKLQCLGDNE
jgi:hypothetical protein